MTDSRPESAASRRLVGIRAHLGGSFDQKCTIETPGASVPNGAGGWMPGSPTVLTGIDCEVRFPKANPLSPDGQAIQTTIERVEVRLPVGTAVSVRSRITVDAYTYEVQGHSSGASFAPEVLCDCLRVDDGATQT